MTTHVSSQHEGLLDVEEERVHVALQGDGAGGNYPPRTFRQVVSAMITLVVAIGATYAVPQLHWARPWTADMDYVPFWNLIGRELLGEGAAVADANAGLVAAQALAREEVLKDETAEPFVDRVVRPPAPEGEKLPAYAGHAEDADRVEMPLENVETLEPFYAALMASELGYAGAITRVMHYGDSAIGNDGIPGAIRAKMQARFGDAGHGFHLLGQPNASYRHQGVRFDERSPWNHCFIIQDCRSDGHYGLGGTTFESTGGAEIRLRTADKGAMGRKASRFELWYAGVPRGGKIKVQLDDQEAVVLETAAETLEDRWYEASGEDGEHTLSVRAAGGGKVRAYGVVMERTVPGVVWDEMSQIGALTRRMSNFEAKHLHSQILHRDPDLLVMMFGGNDMNTQGTMAKYREELTAVLRLFRGAGKDPLPCLIMAPLDHGERDGARIVTRDIVPKIVNAQREVARAEGCAFFDTYAAMGGEGSMGRWVRSNPALGSGDLSHLTHHGHKVVGGMLYRSLVAGYVEHRKRVAGSPAPVRAPAE